MSALCNESQTQNHWEQQYFDFWRMAQFDAIFYQILVHLPFVRGKFRDYQWSYPSNNYQVVELKLIIAPTLALCGFKIYCSIGIMHFCSLFFYIFHRGFQSTYRFKCKRIASCTSHNFTSLAHIWNAFTFFVIHFN